MWLGLVGIADPPRQGLVQTIRALHRAGVRTVMITGDQAATAGTIARELDLAGRTAIEIRDGPDLDAVDEEALTTLCDRADVFSRVTPAQKLRIVQALQRAGHVVAMIGDGINDSPALHAADIGVAMGRNGTDAAREMADIVLADDELPTMLTAIREGRTTYHNIRKAVRYLLSTNLSEIVMMVAMIALGRGEPFSPAQLLWLNLVTDVAPALALGMEHPEPGVLEEPPRDSQMPIFAHHEYRHLAAQGTLLAAGALVAHLLGLRAGTGLDRGTGFLALIVAQLLHAVTSRSRTHGIFSTVRLPPNHRLRLTLAGLAGIQTLATVLPATRRVLGISPITSATLGTIALTGATPFLVHETLKTRRRTGEPVG